MTDVVEKTISYSNFPELRERLELLMNGTVAEMLR